MLRALSEIGVAIVAGWCAMALPVLLASHAHYDAAFLPFMRDVVEGITLTSLLCLIAVGGCLGALALTPVWVLGPASVLTFPAWSAIDIAMGAEHSLFPIEWAIYGFYAVAATVGAIIGWGIRRRTRPKEGVEIGRSGR